MTRSADGLPVVTREGTRPHRVGLTSYDDTLGVHETRYVDLDDDPITLEGWAGRTVLPNVTSETFARLVLDDASLAAVVAGLSRLADPLTRAVVWGVLFDAVHTRDLDVAAYVDVVAAQLPSETHPAIVTAVIARTDARVLPLRAAADEVPALLARLAAACASGLAAAADAELRLAFAEGLTATSSDVALLRSWLEVDAVHGVALVPALRWRVVTRLASLGAVDEGAIEAERLRDGTVDGELGAARALAARPTAEAKAAAWAAATEVDVSNRRFEAVMAGLWAGDDAALVAPYVEHYLASAPEIAVRRGQAFSQIVGRAYPSLPVTAAQVAALDAALAGEVTSVLRRHWEDWRDDLQ